MHGCGKSDRPVVPMKSPNKGVLSPAEGMEGRGLAKENAAGKTGQRTLSRVRPAQCAGRHALGRLAPARRICGKSPVR